MQKRISQLEKEIEQLKNALKNKEDELITAKKAHRKDKEIAEKSEKLLQSVVEAAAGKIGQDFFDNIVIKLSEWLGAECVLIGRKTEDEWIEAVPLYLDGKISHGFSYALAGSPCDVTTRKGFCSYSENVINLFPSDKILVDLNAEGYIGTALYNQEGETNGVICAVSRNKLQVPPYAQNILKIIGARVTAEIERAKVENELKKSEKSLKKSNAAKDKFFSILAHDLRNPMNTIMGFSKLLVKDYQLYSTEELKEFLHSIYDATERTYNLLENLLTWSLSQQKVLEYNPSKIKIKAAVSDVLTAIKNQAADKSITINDNIPDDIYVLADFNMLAVILRNLLSNAIKFTKSGGMVTLSHNILEQNGSRNIEIVVEDNGTGIKKEILKTLFKLESNISTEGTKNEKGTGLGLILCKELIEKHNGKITVESEYGKGSKFAFTVNSP